MGARTVKSTSATKTKRKTLGLSKTAKSRKAASATKGGDYEAADITPEERHRMVAEAAYYRAEQHGFNPDRHMEDWLAAEAEVDNMLESITHQVDTDVSH